MRTYSGLITKLEPNQIFVFGSNTQGRHGKGAALWALRNAGAVYGIAEGLRGQSFAIVTKDLTKSVHPSVSKTKIAGQVLGLYLLAATFTNLEFVVAYSGTGTNLNGYTNEEMAEIFGTYRIPNNIVFEEEFAKLVKQYQK